MKLDVAINLPFLWGTEDFRKTEWGGINYLVGPNGTGKSLVAEELRERCKSQGLRPRFLNAERLVGLERQSYSLYGSTLLEKGIDFGTFGKMKQRGADYGLSTAAYILLQEKLDLRVRVQATLSFFFGRHIRLAEEGGFLRPKVQRLVGDEYDLRVKECHGLKELISLLTFLYDDENNCLIIDEPELHLHPQFQSFLVQEMRRVAGDPTADATKKVFFLITHSPYIVDVRTLDELNHCIVFQPSHSPSYTRDLSEEDRFRLARLLPRLNTHHKQFFFSSRPVFVEGHTDQQLLSLIEEARGRLLGASGACIIDVGGKESLDLFYRLCKNLRIDAQVVTDLDTLFQSKLRGSLSEDVRCRTFMQTQGLGDSSEKPIGELERVLDECIQAFEGAVVSNQPPTLELQEVATALKAATESPDTKSRPARKRYVYLLAVLSFHSLLRSFTSAVADKLLFVSGRIEKVAEAFRTCGVHLLLRGELENYLSSYTGNRYSVPDEAKSRVFETEREFVLSHSKPEIEGRYGDLAAVLDVCVPACSVDMDEHVAYLVVEWMQLVQRAFMRGVIPDNQALQTNATVAWDTYKRVFELVSFNKSATGFECQIRVLPHVSGRPIAVTFTEKTVASKDILSQASQTR